MVNRSLGKYLATQLLGRTPATEVYLARHPVLDRDVALRCFLPGATSNSEFNQRFTQIAQQLVGLRHPHIVQTYDFDIVDDRPMLVVEYVPGGTLQDRLTVLHARGQTLALTEAVRILDAIADALDYAHDNGVAHGNVSTFNILFTQRGEPMLADFGLAQILAAESAEGREADQRQISSSSADVFALGGVLYTMVCGRPLLADPVGGSQVVEPGQGSELPRALNPALPDAAEAVIVKATALDPHARYWTAGRMAGAFHKAVMEHTPPISVAAPTTQTNVVAVGEGKVAAPQEPWMVKLAAVAEVVAPLVGRKAPAPEQTSRDWRGRLAFVFSVISVLFAVMQFSMTFFNVVWSPLAPLITRPLYLIGSLLAISATYSLYTVMRAVTQRQRRRAVTLFSITLLVGATWGGWFAYDYLRPPSGLLITIAEFDGKGSSQHIDFARRIDNQLTTELQDAGIQIEIKRTLEAYPDAATARAQGARQKASLVIWGWYDDMGVSPHVEVLRLPSTVQESIQIPVLFAIAKAAPGKPATAQQPTLRAVERLARSPATLPELKFFTEYGADAMANITAAVIGMGFYQNGDLEHALAMFDRALANEQAGNGPANTPAYGGQEIIYFERANVFQQDGQYDNAITDLEQAVALKPDFYEAHYNLAIAYSSVCQSRKYLDQAIAQVQTAIELQPDQVSAQQLLGQLLIQTGAYTDAVQILEGALTRNAASPETYSLLALAYTSAGQTAAAAQAQQQAITLWAQAASDPARSALETHLSLGDALVGAGKYSEALAQYQQAQRLAPNDPRALHGLANVYYWQGNYDQAEQAYKAWIGQAPRDGNAHLLLGLLYAETKRPKDAINEFVKAVDLLACDPSAHLLLANEYELQNELPAAEKEYRAVLDLDPQNIDARYLLGVVLYSQRRLDEARDLLKAVVGQDGTFVEARFALANVYYDQGDYANAAAQMADAIKGAPTNPVYYAVLAFIYERQERWDDALAAYRKSLALHNDSDIHVYIGQIAMRRQDTATATAEFQQAIALDGTNTLAYNALGSAYLSAGRYDEAISDFQKSLAITDTVFIHTQLARALIGKGNLDAALAEYQTANTLEPTNVATELALGNLLRQLGQLSAAAGHYHAALTLLPNSADAHSGLGQIEYERCHAEGAIREVESALTISPGKTLLQAQLAALYAAQGQNADATKLYRALRDAPSADVFAHLISGGVLAASGDAAGARQEFAMVSENPQAPSVLVAGAHVALGQLALMQDDLSGAQTEFEAALKRYPADAEALIGLGDLALRSNNGMAALERYAQANNTLAAYASMVGADTGARLRVGLHVRMGFAYSRLSNQRAAQKELALAIAMAEDMAKQTPDSPSAHFVLGAVFEANGDVTQAESEYGAAIHCDQSLSATRQVNSVLLAKLKGNPAH